MEEEVTETECCSNCRRDIPAANYVMHVTHCQRNLTLCKVCGEPVPTSQQEEHFEENHAKVKCDCGQHVEKMNHEEHKEKDCPSRLVECQYCELEVAFSELKSHVEYCGSRTEKCDICDRYIQKKDLEAHMDTGCQYPVKEEKNPMPSKRPDDFFSEMPIGMLHAMGLMDSSERSPNMENFFSQLAPGMREFGQILNTGLGTPPFNGASYFGDVDAGDTAFDDRDVIARGARGVRKPRFDQQTSQDSEQVDIDYTHQSDYDDDDEMLAAAYQAEEFDSTNGTSGTSYEPVTEASSDTTQLPCEFCGKLLAMDTLILHQSGCQLRSLDSYPSSGSADVYFDGSRMNNLPQPNNSADKHEEFYELETEDNKDNHDVTFLPCEFCQELFPFDNLIVHQSVCDAGPPSLAPSVLHNGSTPAPLNNTRPTVRSGSQSRPSRPVYESRKIQKPIQNFIPSELDDFGPDSLDVTTSENGRKPDRGNNGFDVVNGAALNNEVPRRTSDDQALHGQSVLRNNNESAINNKLPRKTRDDRGLRGQTVLRNNDLGNREPSKDIPRVKNRTSDQPAKRLLELRGGVTGTSYKGPTVKPIEDGMGPKKINTGARSKPARVSRTSDSNRSTKPNQSSVNEAPERNKTKSTSQAHKFDARSNMPRRTGTDSDNSNPASAMRSNPPRPSKTNVQDSLSSGTNPRRNPPTSNLVGGRLDRGKTRRQETTSESQSSSTQASAPPKKMPIKKKVV